MYKWKPKNIDNLFLMREDEKISILEKYIEMLKVNNLHFQKNNMNKLKRTRFMLHRVLFLLDLL